MADNLYDILNRFTLGQAATAGKNLLGSMGLGLPGGAQAAGPFGPRGIFGGKGSIQQRPIVNPEFMRPDYSGAGERARRFQEYQTGRDIPGANTDYSARLGGGAPAAERAYQQEKARVAQLTAQDPELQRYEKARAAAKTQEEMNAARDIGMQMWAKANPQLAAKVKPGQSGYDAIQGTLAGNAARTGQGFNMAEQLTPTPQGFPTQIPAFPTGAGYSTGYGIDTNLAPGAQTPPPYSGIKTASEAPGTAATSSFGQPNVMNPEDFQKLLNMVRK